VARPAQTVVLADGATLPVAFQAVRTAFSVFGTVTTAGGAPMADVVVTAAAGDHQEQALTDGEGKYRVRGLKPGAEYHVEVGRTRSVRGPRGGPGG